MSNKAKVLFVDDEVQALKYFDKYLASDYSVLTASSVDEAKEILEEQGAEIGVLISDQRMPGQTGVNLLQYTRRNFPQIVRLLTTAYSDLSSAIDSVNQGGAYRYLTKPWNKSELLIAINNAMEFYEIRTERDRLLSEKTSIIQSVLVMDRVRSLLFISSFLSRNIRNANEAVRAYIEQAMAIEGKAFPEHDVAALNLKEIIRQETRSLIKFAKQLQSEVLETLQSDEAEVDFLSQLENSIGEMKKTLDSEGVHVQLKLGENLPEINGNIFSLVKMIEILIRRVSDMDGEYLEIEIELNKFQFPQSKNGIQILLRPLKRKWSENLIASLYSAAISHKNKVMGIDMDILSAFLLAHNQGGTISVQDFSLTSTEIEIQLPVDPHSVSNDVDEEAWLENVYRHIEKRALVSDIE